MIGIYAIRHVDSQKVYVGSSKYLSVRKNRHFNDLRKNRHHNKHLQHAYNKYGEDAFEWVILETLTDENMLHVDEKKWIVNLHATNHNNGYNFNEEPNAMKGRHHTTEAKKKISESRKGRYLGNNNPNFGKKNSLSTKIQMSLGRSKSLSGTGITESTVKEIVSFIKEGRPHLEIAEKFGVGRTVVTRISNGTRWTNITGGPIVPVVYKDGIRKLTELHKIRIGEKHKGMKYKKGG
jgi:group I intron endonuclease